MYKYTIPLVRWSCILVLREYGFLHGVVTLWLSCRCSDCCRGKDFMHEAERHATYCGARTRFDPPVSSATFPEARSDFILKLCTFVPHAIKRQHSAHRSERPSTGPLPSLCVHYYRKPIVAEPFGKRVIKTEDHLNFLNCVVRVKKSWSILV